MNLTAAQTQWLEEIKEYLEQRQDVKDGAYGEQVANEEMRLLMKMEEAGFK